MKNLIFCLVFSSVFVFASSALAADYLTGKIGFYSPEEGVLDNGFNIEGAYGIDVSGHTGIQNLALELGLGYYTSDNNENLFGTRTELDLSVIPVTATAIYTWNIDGPFSLYGGAGLGFYYAMLEAKASGPFGTIKEDDDELEFGLNVVGGGRYKLNNQVDLTAELKYAAVSDDIGGTFINFGVKYNF